MPCVANVPKQEIGDGTMHNAVPVDTVRCSVAGLTTECIMQVHNVKAVIRHNLKLALACHIDANNDIDHNQH